MISETLLSGARGFSRASEPATWFGGGSANDAVAAGQTLRLNEVFTPVTLPSNARQASLAYLSGRGLPNTPGDACDQIRLSHCSVRRARACLADWSGRRRG